MELAQTKRDYHIVAFRGNSAFLNDLFEEKLNMKFIERVSDKGNSIRQLRLESNKQYFNGEGEIYFYLNKNSQPPYIYDILLIDCKKINIFILCIPFKRLAIDIIESLRRDILSKTFFLKADLPKLVDSNKKYTDILFQNNHFTLRSIILKNIDATSNLSSLKIVGKKPLESVFYKKHIQNIVSSEDFGIKKITVKCKNNLFYQVSSSMQIDNLGNYKFFINEKGTNIGCINAVFNLLNYLDCLVETPKNPTTLIDNE